MQASQVESVLLHLPCLEYFLSSSRLVAQCILQKHHIRLQLGPSLVWLAPLLIRHLFSLGYSFFFSLSLCTVEKSGLVSFFSFFLCFHQLEYGLLFLCREQVHPSTQGYTVSWDAWRGGSLSPCRELISPYQELFQTPADVLMPGGNWKKPCFLNNVCMFWRWCPSSFPWSVMLWKIPAFRLDPFGKKKKKSRRQW